MRIYNLFLSASKLCVFGNLPWLSSVAVQSTGIKQPGKPALASLCDT
jgi:hypothetical protein